MGNNKGYQSLHQILSIGGREHQAIDQHAANEQANAYYQRALTMMEADYKQAQHDKAAVHWHSNIVNDLMLATDLGHGHAPMLLAQHAMTHTGRQILNASQILTFLHLSANRDNTEAAYQLGCAYALTGDFPAIEALILEHTTITDKKRSQLAKDYLRLAATTQHSGAVQALIVAYAYGSGFIERDVECLVELCTTLSHQGNQTIALTFGTWLIGSTNTVEISDKQKADPMKTLTSGLPYLLIASSGKDIPLAQKALQYICALIGHHEADNVLIHKVFKPMLIQSAQKANQLLAFYLMWYALDPTEKPLAPEFMHAYDCSALENIISPCAEEAACYFERVIKGDNTMLIEIAHHLSGYIFAD